MQPSILLQTIRFGENRLRKAGLIVGPAFFRYSHTPKNIYNTVIKESKVVSEFRKCQKRLFLFEKTYLEGLR